MITHCDAEETASQILSSLSEKFSFGEKIMNFLTPALALHLGIGTVVVSMVPNPFQ